MTIVDKLEERIKKMPRGIVFRYLDVIEDISKKQAAIKALNRMALQGRIKKLNRGRYYKPEISPLGELIPLKKEVVKDLLERNGKIIGYMTGFSIFNELGLTTQLSSAIQIGSNDVRPSFNRGNFRISFVRQKNKITRNNIPLLQILDAINMIKKIPDADIGESCQRLMELLKSFGKEDPKQIDQMTELVEKYPPSSRALLGALLEQAGMGFPKEQLMNTLNPITTYKINGVSKALPSAVNWNII